MFYDRFIELCNKRGTKPTPLVVGMGLSSSNVSQWKKGSTPRPEVLQKIAEYFGVSVAYLMGHEQTEKLSAQGEELSQQEQAHIKKYRSLDQYGKEAVDSILDIEHRRAEAAKGHIQAEKAPEPEPERGKVIPLYYTPAAAGYASPALGEDYEDYEVPANSKADFAARIQGDSMEPWIADGSVVLVKREGVQIGDVGLFFVDGDMKCKQYCKDNFGNVYLFSLNRERADADVTISASSGITLCCFGRVLLDRRPPLPMA